MATYRVLVFGSTGTGKTSLCNSLTGQKMPVNSSARGVTFKSHTFDSIEFGKNNLIITDTIGLNESDGGTIPAASAATELLQLLNNSKEGYNLLVHVMKAPRITKTHKDNYKLFYERIVQKDIPVILVATGCENDNPMSKWAEENTEHFEKDGFEYREVLATCFIEGGRFESNYAPLRAESKNLVLDAIARYALPSPKKIYFDENSFEELLKRAWNAFCDFADLPEKVRFQIGESAYDFCIRMGVPKELAELVTKTDMTPIIFQLFRRLFK